MTQLDTVAEFTTPEHIAFRFRVAGPLLRFFALLIDWLIRIAIIMLLQFAASLTIGALAFYWIAVIAMILEVLGGGICEWLWKGYTPGKRACGIRVISTDGLPAGFSSCLLRNLMRIADFFPFGFIAGFTCMFTDRRFQRLGDLAAGTVVVYNERDVARNLSVTKDKAIIARAEELPPGLENRLSGEVMRTITAYIERRRRFGSARRNEMAAHLAEPLREQLDVPRKWSADELLTAIYVRCFQLSDGGGAARAANIIKHRRKDWNRLEQLADDSSQRGTATERALQLSQLYRNACADLALAQTYHLPDKQVHYLHDLVSRAHLGFYRRITVSWRHIVDTILVKVPGMLYGDACTRIALLAFFGVFLTSALLAYWQPDIAVDFIGEESLTQFEIMYSDPPNERAFLEGVSASGFYISHNVRIALVCFAAGIFFGIGSLIFLVFNGVFLGLVFGYMGTVDDQITAHFFEFVTAHGPFELTGIALCGAAGLRLGLGFVSIEGLPWRDSLKIAAGRAFQVALVAAAFVAMAAPIEGLISPSSLPIWGKRGVAICSTCVILFYLIVLGGRGRKILDWRRQERRRLETA